MTLSNLPPGVSDNDIPGNRPEDVAFEALYDQIALSGLTSDEAKRRWDSQPDLLEALNEALAFVAAWAGYYTALHELPGLHPLHSETLNKVQAALKQAEGR